MLFGVGEGEIDLLLDGLFITLNGVISGHYYRLYA